MLHVSSSRLSIFSHYRLQFSFIDSTMNFFYWFPSSSVDVDDRCCNYIHFQHHIYNIRWREKKLIHNSLVPIVSSINLTCDFWYILSAFIITNIFIIMQMTIIMHQSSYHVMLSINIIHWRLLRINLAIYKLEYQVIMWWNDYGH